MRFAVTVVSLPGYAHSAAFREVAESLHYALLELGHDSLLSVDPTLEGRRHILLGTNLLPGSPFLPLRQGSILYNLEQAGSAWMNDDLLALFRRHTVWEYSTANVDWLRARGVVDLHLLPIGYMPQLTRIRHADKDIDVLFVGSINERRAHILRQLVARKIKVAAVLGKYGSERDAALARAKVVINIHFYEAKILELVRISYLLANGIPVVSEPGVDVAENRSFADAIELAEYDRLADATVALVENANEQQRLAEAGLKLMQGRPLTSFLAKVLAETGA